ncbi:hypothetical protein [Flavobacterium sp. RSP46]|uniref:hypothetical protein n=1 Tax=Flavobacterium sp. RSP46 TaxID=2497486 RepID=UPI00131564AA|nr:hypothetical protein [Flavobacterium sp. RSP46]
MAHPFFKESPFKTVISFHKLIEALEEIAGANVDCHVNYAKALLLKIERFPV